MGDAYSPDAGFTVEKLRQVLGLNPKPKTQNPKPKTQNPKPKTPNPKPLSLNSQA